MKEENHPQNQAKAQLESILDMVERLNDINTSVHEPAREEIEADALSVQVRSNWHDPGQDADSWEYTILLCTGGPAVRIIGELNDWREPDSATIEYQDWFTGWETYPMDDAEEAQVLDYARCFYYGG